VQEGLRYKEELYRCFCTLSKDQSKQAYVTGNQLAAQGMSVVVSGATVRYRI
jgi:hypothetical protein